MGNVYDASIEFGNEEHINFVLATVAAVSMKLKNYGYSDEAVYEVLPIITGIDLEPVPEKTDKAEAILEAVHELDADEEGFIRRLKKITGGI